MKNKILIGADPEIWIVNNATGKPISAEGLLPGTKEEPHKVMHGAVQVDGMAAEFNILPAENVNQFILHNLSVLRSLRDIIKERNPDLDFSFSFTPVAEFGKEYINNQPEIARRLGCTPDYNAWENGAENPTPDADLPFRTASGHIHVGWGEDYDIADAEHIEACCMMAKQMDFYVGGLVLSQEKAAGKKRRQLYGKAGAFRPKSYGVEYRTASNVWLQNTGFMSTVFRKTQRSFDDLMGGSRHYDNYPAIRDYINTHNAQELKWISGYLDSYDGTAVTMYSLDALFFNSIYYDKTGNLDNLQALADQFYGAKVVKNVKKPKRMKLGDIIKPVEMDEQPLVPAPAPREWQIDFNPIDIEANPFGEPGFINVAAQRLN